MTTIQDTIYNAGGALANGQIVISSPPFTLNGVSVAASQIFVPIVDGVLSVQLYSNMNAQPLGVYYTATYELDQGPVFDEYWVVPNQATVNLGQVRVNFPATPSVMINAQQLTSAGALPGQFLGWSGGNWVPMYVTSFNYYPNFINLMLTGFAGSDLSVSGSPVSLGASVTLNVPDAGAASRGVVNTAAQSFAGNKTFLNNVGVSGTLTAAGALMTNLVVTGNLQAAGSTNLAINPTTTFGDLIVRGNAGALVRFPLGASGTILYADNTQPQGLRWGVAPSGGGGGTNLPAGTNTGDMLYWDQAAPTWAILPVGTPGQVLTAVGGGIGVNWTLAGQSPWTSDIDAAGYMLYNVGLLGVGVATPAFAIDAAGDCNITGAYRVNGIPLVTGVSSVFGRTGAVVAANGDYTAAQVTHAVDQTASYTNPAWIASLPYSKITGVPASLWQSGSGGAIYYNGGSVGIGATTPAYLLDVRNTNGASQAHFSGTGNDDGAYLLAYSSNGIALSAGIAFNGSQWIAKTAAWSQIATVSGNSIQFLNGSGATVGSAVTPMPAATMCITGSNVGIGTTTPLTALDCAGTIRSTAPTSPAPTSGVGLELIYNVGNSTAYIMPYDRGAAVYKTLSITGSSVVMGSNPTTGGVVLQPGGGNVGIGTTAPQCPLDVSGIIRASGTTNSFTSGMGVSLFSNSGAGYVQSYDYTAAAMKPLYIQGNPVCLNPTSAGNVGIGTTAPGAQLVVYGAGQATHSFNTAGALGGTIYLQDSGAGGTNGGVVMFGAAQGPFAAIKGLLTNGTGPVGDIAFCVRESTSSTTLTEAFYIAATGNVGIGCNVPAFPLTVCPLVTPTTPNTAYQIAIGEASNSAGYKLQIGYYLDGGAVYKGSLQTLQNNAVSPLLLNPLGGAVGIGTISPNYTLTVVGDCNITGTYRVNGNPIAGGGGITQITWQAQGAGNWVTGAGAWIVNFTGVNQASVGGGMTGNTVTITISSVSDLRAKQNVETLTGGLSIIDQLRPVRAEWNGAIGKPKGQKLISVIAQEIQEILPEAVDVMRTKLYPDDEEPTDVFTLGDMPIVAHLILAVQQLKAEVEQLKKRS